MLGPFRTAALGMLCTLVTTCSPGPAESADISIYVKKAGFNVVIPPTSGWNVGTLLAIRRDMFRNPVPPFDVICKPELEVPELWAEIKPAIHHGKTVDVENAETSSLKGELTASPDTITQINAKLSATGQRVKTLSLKVSNAKIISIDGNSLLKLEDALKEKCARIIREKKAAETYDIRIVESIFVADAVYTGQTNTGANITVNGDLEKLVTTGITFGASNDAMTKQTGQQITYGVRWPTVLSDSQRRKLNE